MRNSVWALVLALSVGPLFAQDPEDAIELRIGAVFADGNLALRDFQAANHPVQQIKRILDEARVRLTAAQERELNSVVDAQQKAVKASSQNDEAIRRINGEYTAKFYAVLTQDQRSVLRRQRTDQLMMYGGLPGLKVILDNAKTPLTADQEKQARMAYDEFYEQFKQLQRDSKGVPDRIQLDKAENSALAKVIRLLTPGQRRALAASRQGSLSQTTR
jgi:hypothetical protein